MVWSRGDAADELEASHWSARVARNISPKAILNCIFSPEDQLHNIDSIQCRTNQDSHQGLRANSSPKARVDN